MRKVGCFNPSRGGVNSLKQIVTAPLVKCLATGVSSTGRQRWPLWMVVPCHSRRGTFKNHHCSMPMSVEYRSEFQPINSEGPKFSIYGHWAVRHATHTVTRYPLSFFEDSCHYPITSWHFHMLSSIWHWCCHCLLKWLRCPISRIRVLIQRGDLILTIG